MSVLRGRSARGGRRPDTTLRGREPLGSVRHVQSVIYDIEGQGQDYRMVEQEVEVMFKDIPKNPSGYGMELTSEEIEQAVAEMRGAQMNNLQHIVKDNIRFAMHMAVELCERGDFDSVNEALRWLMKERDDVATPSGGDGE